MAIKCLICGLGHTQKEHYILMREARGIVTTPDVVTEKFKEVPEKVVPTPKPVSTVATSPVSTVSTKTDYERVKIWRKDNREKYNESMREWRKNKRKFSHLESMAGDGI